MPTFQFFNLLQGEEGITLDVEGLHSKGVLAVRVDVDVLIDPPSVRVQGGGPRRLCKVETLSLRQTKNFKSLTNSDLPCGDVLHSGLEVLDKPSIKARLPLNNRDHYTGVPTSV